MKPVFVLQRILPDYREGFYAALQQLIPNKFVVTNGVDRFTDALKPSAQSAEWILSINNTYLLRNRLLWQSGRFRQIIIAPLLVAELNPRILSTWLFLLLRRILRRPSVVWGHSRSLGKRQGLIRKLRFWQCRLACGVLAYTSQQADEFRKEVKRLQVFVAPNACVHESQCEAISNSNRFSVLYVGRLIAEKKLPILFQAFCLATKRLPADVTLEIVGDGPLRSELQGLAKQLGLEGRIHFHGHVLQAEELARIYDRALCSVSPGYVGLTAIQSIARGVPMVVADKESHSPEIEACKQGETAMFFKAGNAQDLASALVQLYEQKEMWEARREALCGFIRATYTYQAMARSFVAMVDAMMARGRQCAT
jgi:glycosyltransferase involved in cell wall biosynthesis